MKPQAALFLDKARQQVERADTMLGVGLNEDAGRAAYLGGLHAAQAFIFEITGQARNTDSGVQREFARLVSGSAVTPASAGEAVQTAKLFVANVANLIPTAGRTPAASETSLR